MILDHLIPQMFLNTQDIVRTEFKGLHLTLDQTKHTFSLTRAGGPPTKLDVEIVEAVLFTLNITVSKNKFSFSKGDYHVVRLSYAHKVKQPELFPMPKPNVYEYA